MTGRLFRALKARLRPPKFPAARIGAVQLDDMAEPVADEAELVRSARPVAFCEILPQSGEILSPAFLLGDAPLFEPGPHIVPPARLYRVRGETRIFGKGLFVRDGALVLLDALKFYELGRLDYPVHRLSVTVTGQEAVARMPAGTRRIAGPCLYLAQGGEAVWGHWLVDILPRLALARRLPIRLPVILDSDRPSWVVPLLRHCGVRPSQVVWHDKFRETLVVDDLYVPTFLRLGNVFSPLAERGWDPVPARAGAARLYVSRSRLRTGSSLANAAEIEGIAREGGYRVVHPERLGVAAQVELFGGAASVVGEGGSAMHNTVFSPAGTRVAVLQAADDHRFVQAGIGSRRGQPTGFVFGSASEGGRFHLPPELFREALRRMADPPSFRGAEGEPGTHKR